MSLLNVFLLFAAIFGWYRAYTFYQIASELNEQMIYEIQRRKLDGN